MPDLIYEDGESGEAMAGGTSARLEIVELGRTGQPVAQPPAKIVMSRADLAWVLARAEAIARKGTEGK